MKSRKLILVRHGETDWNVEGRLTSFTDIDLNKRGEEQAQLVGSLFKDREIVIRSSPSVRALQTAHYISSATTMNQLNPPIISDHNLKEINFGPFEGMTRPEMVENSLERTFFDWINGETDSTPLGCESLVDATRRANILMEQIRLADEPVTVWVTHGHFGRIFLSSCILNSGPGNHRKLRFDNAHLAVVSLDDNEIRLVQFNVLQTNWLD